MAYDILIVVGIVFFFKQKTAYEMRISDWSSDVCSSDLRAGARRERGRPAAAEARAVLARERHRHRRQPGGGPRGVLGGADPGRDRERPDRNRAGAQRGDRKSTRLNSSH